MAAIYITGAAVPAREDPEYAALFKKLRIGMPRPAVDNACRKLGLDPSVLDNPDEPVPGRAPLPPEPGESKAAEERVGIILDFGVDVCRVGFATRVDPSDALKPSKPVAPLSAFPTAMAKWGQQSKARNYAASGSSNYAAAQLEHHTDRFGAAALACAHDPHGMWTVVNPWEFTKGLGRFVHRDVEKLIHQAFFAELRWDPANPELELPVVLTVPLLLSKGECESLTQIMFETFQVPAFYLHTKPVLSMYSVGKTSGVVVQLDGELGYVGPVYEAFLLPHATHKFAMEESGAAAAGVPAGLPEAIVGSVKKVDPDIQKDMLCEHGIILSGSSSESDGLAQRVAEEVQRLWTADPACCDLDKPIKFEQTAGGDAAFYGGLKFAGLEACKSMFITKAEYDKIGPRIVHGKCP